MSSATCVYDARSCAACGPAPDRAAVGASHASRPIPPSAQAAEPCASAGVLVDHRAAQSRMPGAFATVTLKHSDYMTTVSLCELLNFAGKYIGIGDWRPEGGGPFGSFHVTRAQLIGEKLYS